MGPKKAAPAKKKEGTPESGGELTPEEKAKLFMLTCQSLQVQLAERSEEAAKALATKREYQDKFQQISRDFEEEKKITYEITQDMTRQYKGMQEELLSRINKLEETVQDLTDKLAESEVRQEKLLREKNLLLNQKEEEISELRRKMDDMAEEFGEMLRETLEKMRERIEVTSGAFDSPDLVLQQKLEEIKIHDN
eukprot:gene33953-41089_t